MVDRGGLNYPIRVRDEFSRNTRKFREEIRASKREFREFQQEAAGRGGARRGQTQQARQARVTDRFQQKRLRTLQNLRDQTRLLADAEVRRARDLRRSATANERSASSVEQKRRAEQAAARAAKESERAERRLRLERERQARRDNRAQVQGLEQRRRRELQSLRANIEARAAAQEQERRNLQRTTRERERQAALGVQQLARRQRQTEQLAVAQRRAQRAEQAQRDRRNADVQAERRLNQELFQRQVTLRQISQLRQRSRGQFAAGDLVGGRDSVRRARQLEQSLKGSREAAGGLLFTFRRLVGVLAIFTLAREGVRVFGQLVAAGVRFNDTVEASTIGVAGLISTLTDVRDPLGRSVTQAEELGLAMGLAREQIRALRQDSLRTTATFEQLLDTFQVAVAPGFAAGLELDEIRQLTTQISQAATAIGLPQNQLAEEIRSLLAGTIQARTTRIATALGITNADIRRLKESGELFEFLEERLAGFDEAAQRAARETFTGITTLLRGAAQELLGQAAQPLFEELLSLGNDLFDNVLTIVDEAGNIRPNPEAVAAFQSIFDALRQGVVAAREFGEELGFEGLQDFLGTLGSALVTAIRAGIGAARVFSAVFTTIVGIVRSISSQFGITVETLGSVAAVSGGLLTAWALLRNASKLIGLNWQGILATVTKVGSRSRAFAASAGVLVAAFAAVGVAVNFILEKMFGVNLNIQDTAALVVAGLLGAFTKVAEVVTVLGNRIQTGLVNALDTVVSAAREKATGARAFIAELFGDSDEAVRLFQEQERIRLESENRIGARRKELEEDIAGIRLRAAEKQAEIDRTVAQIVSENANEQAEGGGFDPNFDPQAAADAAAGAAGSFISTADKPINDLAESLVKINDELRKAQIEFEQAGASAGLGGFAGQVEGIFGEQEIANAERLRQIRGELEQTEERIAELRGAGVAEDAGELVTLLRDEADLRDAINMALEQSNQLALTRAATEAQSLLPSLRRENTLLQAQVAQQHALTAAKLQDVSARQEALLTARAELETARIEKTIAEEQARARASALQARIAETPEGDERQALQTTLDALRQRERFEQSILALRIQQLEKAREEANLVANGSLTDGLRAGFKQFANEFSSTYEAGLRIARQGTEQLTQFVSSSIVDAFDPTAKGDLKEKFARFLQSIAQLIIQELVRIAIVKRLLGSFFPGAGGAHEGGEVPADGFHSGGRAPRPRGFAAGGRPRGVSQFDTVPAYLQPGEFVIRKSVVDKVGASMFQRINSGNVSLAASAAAGAGDGGAQGFQAGGLVADRIQEAQSVVGSGGGSGGGRDVVLPVMPAGDREIDQLMAGGRNAFLAFARENAADLNAVLDRERR